MSLADWGRGGRCVTRAAGSQREVLVSVPVVLAPVGTPHRLQRNLHSLVRRPVN